MTRPDAKEHELAVVRWYLAHVGLNDVVVEPWERPDALVRIGERVVGVELTTYHQQGKNASGLSLRALEEHWEKLRHFAMDQHARWPVLGRVSVNMEFRQRQLPSHREFASFTERVAALADAMVGESQINSLQQGDGIVGQYVQKLTFDRDGGGVWHWNYDFGWIGVTEPELVDIVRGKAAKDPSVPLDERWLIIAEGGYLSGAMGRLVHEQVGRFGLLNRTLRNGPFARVVILAGLPIQWELGRGWATLPDTREVT